MTASARSTQAQFALLSKHPVVAAGGNSVECESCHNPHVVDKTTGKVTDPANTYNLIAYNSDATQATFCLKCHSAAASLPAYAVNGTTYVPYTVTIAAADQTLMNKNTNAARGHWSITGAIGSGEEVTCAECHDNHGSNYRKLLGVYDAGTASNKIAGAALTGNDNSVCAACHTSATGTGYTRLGNGYPNVGTWPGTSVYNGATGIHKVASVIWPSTTYGGGDCKNCHDVHGTAEAYDETVAQFGPSAANDNYALCFECHDGSPSTRDIKRYFPIADGGTAVQTSSSNFGHKIQTAGGTIAVGEGLPCYDCHAVHGSAVADGLQVETSIGGTKYMLGDAATEINMSTAAGIRLFCFACHTGDVSATDSTIQGTNSAGTGFTTISAATDFVEGIDRTLYSGSGTKTGLRLPPINGHYTSVATQSCYACHGNSYADAASNNVHNPGPGASQGGQDCYICHDYQSAMEDDLGTKTGTDNALSYHHVLGSSSFDGDKAFAAGSYPTSTTDVYCLSCHVDHDKFNASKAANLRPDVTATNPTGAATDYNSTSNTGVCTACHATSLAKQGMGAEQKDDGSTATPKVVPGGAAGQFGASAHDYYATSTFGSGNTFNANCSKCHNDEQSKSFQDSTFQFGTHWSSYQRILSALGSPGGGTGSSSATLYASGYTETGGTWTNPGNSLNAPDDASAVSSNSEFELRQSFSMPAGMTAITAASIQVRSQASGGWGTAGAGSTGNTVTLMATSDYAVVGTIDGSTSGSTAPWWDDIDDPVGTPNDADLYSVTTANGYVLFGFATPSIPTNATNISVTVNWRAEDEGGAGNNRAIERIMAGGTLGSGTNSDKTGTGFSNGSLVFATNPATTIAWTAADINGTSGTPLQAFGFGAGSDAAPNVNVSQCYAVVTYDLPGAPRDDTWQIDYSLDSGATWLAITAASTTNEAGLGNHPATPLDLTGVLTPSNASNFRLRVKGTAVNGLDPAGPVMNVDGATLTLTYDYSTAGGLLAEKHCYRCHSRTTDTIGGTVKSTALRDYYNAVPMTAASERVYAQFQLTSKHPVEAAGGDSVECESCHNAHVVTTTAGTGRTTDPDNSYNTIAFNSDATQVAFCLKCHDGGLPAYTVNGTTYIPY
jgi:nitrate/TMAO reductase-like tetraheme cytochrome c subunit